MKNRYRLMSRGARGGAFYCVDSLTGKRTSLGKVDRDASEQIVLAKNQALRQPSLNLHIARAFMAGSDSGVNTRTWQDALNAIIESKQGPTRYRRTTAAKDHAFDAIRRAILDREPNSERRAFYELCWHLGGAQNRVRYAQRTWVRALSHRFLEERGACP